MDINSRQEIIEFFYGFDINVEIGDTDFDGWSTIADLLSISDQILDQDLYNAVSDINEIVTLQRQHGNVYQVVFSWRGKIYGMKIFFPQVKRLTRKEVNEAIQKIYPNATLRTYFVTGLKYGEPYINVNVGDWSGTK